MTVRQLLVIIQTMLMIWYFLTLNWAMRNGFDIAEQIVLMNNDAIIIFVTSQRIWFMKHSDSDRLGI